MQTVPLDQVKEQLTELIHKAANGESFLISEDGMPVVQVTRVPIAASVERRLGFMRGMGVVPQTLDPEGDLEIAELFESSK